MASMTATASTQRTEIRLELEGMTCASCAARIEKKLNKLDGVEATVNFATEQANVRYDATRVNLEQLVAAVEGFGYAAALPAARTEEGDPTRSLRLRLVVAAALTTPLVALAMIPPLQFGGWEWLALALGTPVVLWSGWRFHRAAALNARHGLATMDTLISLGTLAAWGWSSVVLVSGSGANTYFEVGAVITTLILLGRFLEGVPAHLAPGGRAVMTHNGFLDLDLSRSIVEQSGLSLRIAQTVLVCISSEKLALMTRDILFAEEGRSIYRYGSYTFGEMHIVEIGSPEALG